MRGENNKNKLNNSTIVYKAEHEHARPGRNGGIFKKKKKKTLKEREENR